MLSARLVRLRAAQMMRSLLRAPQFIPAQLVDFQANSRFAGALHSATPAPGTRGDIDLPELRDSHQRRRQDCCLGLLQQGLCACGDPQPVSVQDGKGTLRSIGSRGGRFIRVQVTEDHTRRAPSAVFRAASAADRSGPYPPPPSAVHCAPRCASAAHGAIEWRCCGWRTARTRCRSPNPDVRCRK